MPKLPEYASFYNARKARSAVIQAGAELKAALDAASDPKTDPGVRAARIRLIRAQTAQQKAEVRAREVHSEMKRKEAGPVLVAILGIMTVIVLLMRGCSEW